MPEHALISAYQHQQQLVVMAVLVAIEGFRGSRNVTHELGFSPLLFNLTNVQDFTEGDVRPLGVP